MTTETKTITQLLTEQSRKGSDSTTELSSSSCRKNEISRCETNSLTNGEHRHRWLSLHNPSTQIEQCSNIQDCYFGPHETLAILNKNYGNNTASMWLVAQLVDLSEYAGAKEKIKPNMLTDCAKIISNEYYFLKYTELMLFFYKFKKSEYGKFYGSIDPLTIMSALKDFVAERNILIDRHEQELRSRKDAEYRKTAISRKEWEEIKKKRKSA